jgi:hypothetical protein
MVDPSGAPRGRVSYTRCQMVPRYNDVGTWSITAPLSPTHALPAAPGWRVMILDGADIYGGPMAEAEIQFGPDRRPQIVLSGEDDLCWLRDREAWPTPAAAIGSQATPYDIRTGVASTVMRAYVDANAGPGAQVFRRVAGLTLAADPAVGGTVTGRARFHPVLEVLQGLGVTGNTGFRVTAGLTSAKVFETFTPRDRTAKARFSVALGNLRSLRWSIRRPDATTIIGGGRGEEAARLFISVSDSGQETAWGRRENFYDYRSASDVDAGAELTEGANRRLEEAGETRTVEVQPIDTARLRFGRAADGGGVIYYWLGDTVTIDVYGPITVPAIMREVEITIQRTGQGATRTVVPRVGDIGTTGSTRETLLLRDALSRIGRLERR